MASNLNNIMLGSEDSKRLADFYAKVLGAPNPDWSDEAGAVAMLTTQAMPNRSTHMPNSSAHICVSRGTVTVPPPSKLAGAAPSGPDRGREPRGNRPQTALWPDPHRYR